MELRSYTALDYIPPISLVCVRMEAKGFITSCLRWSVAGVVGDASARDVRLEGCLRSLRRTVSPVDSGNWIVDSG